jgi:transcription-repair coupling factor (superfamily II helicase)
VPGSGATPVVVAPWTALAARVPTRESVRARSVHLEVGQTIDRDALVATLVAGGYARMPLVEDRGELAVRGGILDLFPPQRPRPVRVELLGDEVESIREFDAASQRSQEALGYVVAPPPRELLLDRDLVIDRSAAIRDLAASQDIEPRAVDELLNDLLRGHIPPGAEALAPLLLPSLESVFDFLPDDTWIVVDDPEAGRERLARYAADAFENFEVARASGRVVAPPTDLMLSPEEIEEHGRERRPVFFERLDVADSLAAADRISLRTEDHAELRRALLRSRTSNAALAPLAEQLTAWREDRWRTVLTSPSLSGAERLRALLSEYGVTARTASEPRPVWRWSGPGSVEVRTAALSAGFALPLDELVVVTEEEIFGPRERRPRRAHWPEGAAIEALSQLSLGDYVVHAEHGIGTYRGLVELRLGGAPGEFLRLEYEGADRLFVPVYRLNLIQRFAGSDGKVPRIDKLGGASWEKAKRGVRRSLRNMTQELLAVHAARELAPGHAFSPRDRHLEEFEATFPYEETPDQLAAIEDVLSDLRQPKPSDRLVCGDVGYGKTEVAVRAAFRVAMDGKQVAVLVPTTVLCQQHEETFRERFEGHPIEIESLSRFRTNRQAKCSRASRRGGSTSSSGPIGCFRRTSVSAIWACSSSTRSIASASPTRNASSRSRRPWTC